MMDGEWEEVFERILFTDALFLLEKMYSWDFGCFIGEYAAMMGLIIPLFVRQRNRMFLGRFIWSGVEMNEICDLRMSVNCGAY